MNEAQVTPAVETAAVLKVYPQGGADVRALSDVTLRIDPREFVVLAGPSGSGKTTLLNLIGALDRPTAGSIRVGGQDLGSLTSAERARVRRDHIGFVFQAYNLLPVLSALENAALVLELQGLSRKESEARAASMLRSVGLGDLVGRRPNALSGGQQQRVAVARAIASARTLVLADEPTANLDSKSAESLLELMMELNQERGLTFVFSSHDPRVIARARRVIRLEDGRVVGDERVR
ncbi:MAG TPA: ABC transporter ATP-binding protein [Polyangiaceae bacterium]|nr:ABC transporter ATP-binding protein [Polyangiaceae bacterium]